MDGFARYSFNNGWRRSHRTLLELHLGDSEDATIGYPIGNVDVLTLHVAMYEFVGVLKAHVRLRQFLQFPCVRKGSVFGVVLNHLDDVADHVDFGSASKVIAGQVVGCLERAQALDRRVVQCEVLVHPHLHKTVRSEPDHLVSHFEWTYPVVEFLKADQTLAQHVHGFWKTYLRRVSQRLLDALSEHDRTQIEDTASAEAARGRSLPHIHRYNPHQR